MIRETTSFTRLPADKGSSALRPRNKHKHGSSQVRLLLQAQGSWLQGCSKQAGGGGGELAALTAPTRGLGVLGRS